MITFIAICLVLSAVPAVLVALARPEPDDPTPHLVTSPRGASGGTETAARLVVGGQARGSGRHRARPAAGGSPGTHARR